MKNRFPENPQVVDKYLDEFARDMADYDSFKDTQSSYLRQLELVSFLQDDDSLQAEVYTLKSLIDRLVNQFGTYSHTILSRPDKELAVNDWVDFAISNTTKVHLLSAPQHGSVTTHKVNEYLFPRYAWSYIKQNNLDPYNTYNLDDRSDLDDDYWISDGYAGLLRRHLAESLEDSNTDAFHLFISIDQPYEPEISEQDLRRTASDIHTAMTIDFSTTQDFLDYYAPAIENTSVFATYMLYSQKILDAVDRKNQGIIFSDLRQDCDILHTPAFLEGFRFALIINNHLLNPINHNHSKPSIDQLEPYVHSHMNDILEEIAESKDIDESIYQYGMFLYENSIVHPEASNAKTINSQLNPLKELTEYVTMKIYNSNDDDANHSHSSDFYAGFGLGRALYTAYQADV